MAGLNASFWRRLSRSVCTGGSSLRNPSVSDTRGTVRRLDPCLDRRALGRGLGRLGFLTLFLVPGPNFKIFKDLRRWDMTSQMYNQVGTTGAPFSEVLSQVGSS